MNTGSDAPGDADDVGAADGASEAANAPADAVNPPETPVVLFDGVCNLCNGVIQFLIPRDPEGRLKYAALQSEAGQALLERHDFPTEEFDSFVLVEGEKTYTKSGAAIRIAELLGWPYRIAGIGRVVPRRLRDRLYEFVADNRYDWFGRKDQCMIPDEDVSDRFLS
jgi:predicted DCC family thiol-disulfide oxidoreductase YuxK